MIVILYAHRSNTTQHLTPQPLESPKYELASYQLCITPTPSLPLHQRRFLLLLRRAAYSVQPTEPSNQSFTTVVLCRGTWLSAYRTSAGLARYLDRYLLIWVSPPLLSLPRHRVVEFAMRGTLLPPAAVHAYVAPVPSSLFLSLWIGLLVLGIAATGWFFVYEVSVSSRRRSIVKESAIAGTASSLIGFGVIFLMLWAGVWV